MVHALTFEDRCSHKCHNLTTFFLHELMQHARACSYMLHAKGKLISKGSFGVFNFFQKTNENTSHSSKNEFIPSFLEDFSLAICFRNQLTF